MKAMLVGWLRPVTTVLTERFGSSIDGPLAWVVTVVSVVAELSAVSGSVSLAVTVAVLLNWPVACGVTTIFAVADAPFARFPKLQVTVVVPEHVPCVGVAETK